MNFAQITNKQIYEAQLPDGQAYGQIGPRDTRRFKDTSRHIIPKVQTLLDVGCFGGDWLHFILKHRPKIKKHLGIEVAQNKVDEAKNKYPELHIQCGYAEKLDMEPGSFDVVTCLEVLEHITDWESVFNSLFRFASKQVIITVPYKENIIRTPCIHCGNLTPMYGHLRSYSEESFPQVSGWSLSIYKIRDRDPKRSKLRKMYNIVKPRFPWFLMNYRKDS